MPTETQTETDPQRYLLTPVRQSQAAVIDTIRTWTTFTEQLTPVRSRRRQGITWSNMDTAG